MTTPAPSPMTNPSRSLSQGREARSGVSLKLAESARAAAKPASPRRLIAASVPPARHHDVGILQHDQPRRVADRVCAGRAGGDDRVVRTLEAVADGDVAGG